MQQHDSSHLSVVQRAASTDDEGIGNPAPQALKECVEQTMVQYFTQLDGQPVTNIYEMVLLEVEAPLLRVVMQVCQGNQCRAAEMMGISRGTLRKKLQLHGML